MRYLNLLIAGRISILRGYRRRPENVDEPFAFRFTSSRVEFRPRKCTSGRGGREPCCIFIDRCKPSYWKHVISVIFYFFLLGYSMRPCGFKYFNRFEISWTNGVERTGYGSITDLWNGHAPTDRINRGWDTCGWRDRSQTINQPFLFKRRFLSMFNWWRGWRKLVRHFDVQVR